ncbi:MAG: FAD-binding oxidoreductase, partial [Sandaracinaceae bacterium]
TATLGAGARLSDVYAGTAPHSLAVPGGTCASVGISGLTLGGGQGVLGRKHGLTCDSLRALTLITAAGDVVTCDASDNEDLYWASRGAGGGNFGVATSFTFDAYPVDTLTRFSARFTWAAARDVVAGWQEWMQGAPPELWSALHLNTSGTARGASLAGCYAGPERALAPHLAALRRRMGRALRRAPSTITAGYLDTMRAEAGCSERTIDECHLPTAREGGQLGRRSHEGFSNIYRAPLTTRGIAALVELIEARGPDAAGAGGVAIDALGGAIDRLAPDATAFVHRGAFAIAQCSTHWPARVTEAQIRANRAWHRQLRRTMARHVGGGAYVNYIDPALRDHETVYYGDNLARLRQIKARRDPDGFFRFAQGIRASG